MELFRASWQPQTPQTAWMQYPGVVHLVLRVMRAEAGASPG